MRIYHLPLLVISSFLIVSLWFSSGCGPQPVCDTGETKVCTCPNGKASNQTCNTENTGFIDCICATKTETSGEKKIAEKNGEALPEPDAAAEPEPDTAPDGPRVIDDPAPEPYTGSDDSGPGDTGKDSAPGDDTTSEPAADTMPDQPSNCPADSVMYLGKCMNAQEYCTQRFTTDDQARMFSPHTLVKVNAQLVFCQTKLGSYFLPGNGYGDCDADGDGWITIESYRAVTHNEKIVRDNARCKLRQIEAFVYHSDLPNTKPQLQLLQSKVPLLETFRNDGQGKLLERPIYTNNQVPLPKGSGSDCGGDGDCTNKLCYKGHCIEGRRFDAAEINTLTKACIAGLDLNDNQLDDASENPTDSPTPKNEFEPLLQGSYFMELHHGYYEAAYDNKGQKLAVYHLKERSRRSKADDGLQLNCGEDKFAKTPDYWRSCRIRGDQKCLDPSTKMTRKGLSACWLPNVRVATPSLFKCVTHQASSYFDPGQYGVFKNYTRPRCKAVSSLNPKSLDKRDVKFECAKDDGKQAPKIGQNEVGWACVSFKEYNLTGDYLAGCIDECTESKKGGGGVGPCGENDACQRNKTTANSMENSYGQGEFGCFSGKSGVCSDGTTLCNWGKYDTCTSNTQPSTEICNNKDDDCDGRVDEDIAGTKCWSGSAATRGVGACTDGVEACNGGVTYCTKEFKPTAEICDGKDNDCDNNTDRGCPQKVDIRHSASSTYTRLNLVGDINRHPSSSEQVSDAFVHCPNGEALRGIEFWVDQKQGVTFLQTLCGPITLKEERTTNPYRYSVESSGFKVFEKQGKRSIVTSDVWVSLKCPMNTVVVGIEGEASKYSFMDCVGCPVKTYHRAKYLALRCAPLIFKGTTPSTMKVEYGTITKTAKKGLNDGSPLRKDNPVSCPQGEAAVEIWASKTSPKPGNYTRTYFTGISVTCRPIVLTRKP